MRENFRTVPTGPRYTTVRVCRAGTEYRKSKSRLRIDRALTTPPKRAHCYRAHRTPNGQGFIAVFSRRIESVGEFCLTSALVTGFALP